MSLPVVIVDTREKKPRTHLEQCELCTYKRHGLSVGDYSLDCFCEVVPGKKLLKPTFAAEWKDPSDYLGSMHGVKRVKGEWVENIKREKEKIWRAAEECGFSMPYFIGGNETDLRRELNRAHWKRQRITWDDVVEQMAWFRARGIQIITSASEFHAERNMLELFLARLEKYGPAPARKESK